MCFLCPVPNLVALITSPDPSVRNTSLELACAGATAAQLLAAAAELDAFRRRADNLYERVRALFFLAALHRFHLPPILPVSAATSEFEFEGVRYRQREQFFCVRAPRFTVDDASWTDVERRSILGHRWWSRAELATTTEIVFPAELPDILGELLG